MNVMYLFAKINFCNYYKIKSDKEDDKQFVQSRPATFFNTLTEKVSDSVIASVKRDKERRGRIDIHIDG